MKTSKTYKVLIGTAIVSAIILIGYVMFKGKLPKKSKTTAPAPHFLTNKTTKRIITNPADQEKTKRNIIVVYGGISYATPNFMYDQLANSTAKDLLLTNHCIFVPYNSTWNNVKDSLQQIQTKYSTGEISLVGFSAGGLDVIENYTKDYKVVGLIDNSTNNAALKVNYGKNVIMVYNTKNWGGYLKIKALLPKLATKIKQAGGIAEQVNLSHKKIPSYFFETYKHKFL